MVVSVVLKITPALDRSEHNTGTAAPSQTLAAGPHSGTCKAAADFANIGGPEMALCDGRQADRSSQARTRSDGRLLHSSRKPSEPGCVPGVTLEGSGKAGQPQQPRDHCSVAHGSMMH